MGLAAHRRGSGDQHAGNPRLKILFLGINHPVKPKKSAKMVTQLGSACPRNILVSSGTHARNNWDLMFIPPRPPRGGTVGANLADDCRS